MTSALPGVQVLVDWSNNPIGPDATAGNNFTDISVYVKLDAGVNISRGRQDNISVVQPSRCTFTVHNDDGRFSPSSSASPYYPGVILGRRVQVNVQDESAVWHTRFDGMIAEYDINDTATGKDTTVTITCADVLSFLNRYPSFSCWTVQECQFQAAPVLTYLCNDSSAAGGLAESSGNGGPTLTPATYDSPPFVKINVADTTTYALDKPVISYQSGQDPVEGAVEPTFAPTPDYPHPVTSSINGPLQSVNFAYTLENAGTATNPTIGAPSAQFQGKLPNQLKATSGKEFTLLGWIWPDGLVYGITAVEYNSEVICLGNARTSSMLSVEINANGGLLTYQATFFDNYVTNSAAGVTTDGPTSAGHFILNAPVMVAIVVSGTTATFYLGGNIFNEGVTLLTGTSTITIPDGTTFDTLLIGGPLGGGNGFMGNISNVNVYDVALNSTQLTDLASFGAIGSELKSVGTAFTRAAVNYTGLPSYWVGTIDDGLSHVDYFDITGSNPATVMQTLQALEHGLAFVDSSGKLNFHDRSRRMGATSPVALPAGSYNPGIAPKINDQYLINSAAYQSNRGGNGITAQDATSVAQYGVYPNGSVTSPQQGPYPTFTIAYQAKSALVATQTTFEFLYQTRTIVDAASWDVNTLGQPTLKLAELTIDRLGNTSGQDEYVAPSVLYGLEINSSVFINQNLPWWPNTPEASELFIEGVTEEYKTDAATVAFYTSPAFQSRAWIPGDSTYGQLDVTARVGISKTGSLSSSSLMWPVPPTYGSTMNLGAGANGFVGATDQAGISENLQRLVTPPMLYAAQKTTTQTVGLFGGFFPLTFDTIYMDTVAGFNFINDGGYSYVVQVPGWYEIYATAVIASPVAADTYTVMITQNQTAQATLRQLAPVTVKGTTGDLGLTTSAVAYLALGDNISVSIASEATSVTTSTGNGGSSLSMRFLGQGTNRN